VVILARSGHMSFVDQMDGFLHEVADFLDSE